MPGASRAASRMQPSTHRTSRVRPHLCTPSLERSMLRRCCCAQRSAAPMSGPGGGRLPRSSSATWTRRARASHARCGWIRQVGRGSTMGRCRSLRVSGGQRALPQVPCNIAANTAPLTCTSRIRDTLLGLRRSAPAQRSRPECQSGGLQWALRLQDTVTGQEHARHGHGTQAAAPHRVRRISIRHTTAGATPRTSRSRRASAALPLSLLPLPGEPWGPPSLQAPPAHAAPGA
jgi:hypothetical protein